MDFRKLYLKNPDKAVITIYIRPDTKIENIKNLLKKEEPIISNIKSRVTRRALGISFQKVKTFIENIRSSENGYIIVSSPEELVWTSDVLIKEDLYRCGSEFYSGPFEEIQMNKLSPIGVICLDTKEATLGFIGNKIEILKHLTSGIGGKHKKGGQSQRRFERLRKERIKEFFKRIGEASNLFLTSYPITHLLISGCGLTKDKFLKGKYLDYRLKEKVLDSFDTQYTGESGIRETLHLALPKLEKNAYAKEVKEVEAFFNTLGKHFDSVVYGEEEVKEKMPFIKKLIKIEEHTKEYPKETITLHFHGEHYEKIRALGGICGIKN